MPLPPAAARRRPSPHAVRLATGLGAVLSSRGHGEPLPRTLLGWALTATGCAALLRRRRHPVPVAAEGRLIPAVVLAAVTMSAVA
ncbi:hypothetical protein [Streptomyces rimosus]